MSGGEGERPASFQHLVDTMPGAVFLRDQVAVAERRMSYVSPQAERVTGVSAWRWLAPNALDVLGEFLDERTLAEYRGRADAAAERGEQYDAVFRIRGDDGRIRWVRHHSVVVPDAPHTRIGFWLDVTEYRYHDMVEGLPAIVAVLDMNADKALFVNPQAERIGEAAGHRGPGAGAGVRRDRRDARRGGAGPAAASLPDAGRAAARGHVRD